MELLLFFCTEFQSTYLYKVRLRSALLLPRKRSFNPRTYIRYDDYLPQGSISSVQFQSTYLYKVRPVVLVLPTFVLGFNPRTYIRYDYFPVSLPILQKMFQSTYLYKVRRCFLQTQPTLHAVSIHVPI